MLKTVNMNANNTIIRLPAFPLLRVSTVNVLLINNRLLFTRFATFSSPFLSHGSDLEFNSRAVTHVFDLMLDAGGDKSIGFGVRDAFGHLFQLVVFQKRSDLCSDLRAETTGF